MLIRQDMTKALEGSFAAWSPWDGDQRVHLFELVYGIGCEPETMDTVAERFGISTGRVQQLISQTATTLAKVLGPETLDAFVKEHGKPVTKTYVWHQRPPSEYLTKAGALKKKRAPWTRLEK